MLVEKCLYRCFDCLGDAWLYGLDIILNSGREVVDTDVRKKDIRLSDGDDLATYYDERTKKISLKLREINGYHITIKNASMDDDVIVKYADKNRIDYTIMRYGKDCGEGGYGEFLRGKNDENIEQIVNKIAQNKYSKSSIIISPNSWCGNFGKAPCLTAVDFLVRDNALKMFVFYRSQNVYTKQPGNLIALSMLQAEIANKLNIKKGELELFVCSAHIYECDYSRVEKILKDSGYYGRK